MNRRVLIPIDFSPASAEALAVARQFCQGGTKRLLHVLNPKQLAEQSRHTGSPVHTSEVRREAEEKALERLRTWALGDDEIAFAVGNPAEAIRDHADEWGADLIVMGTRGRSGIANFLSGSATEWLVRNARQPILVVHDVPIDSETACQLPPG